MLVQRRATFAECPQGGDSMCTYDALVRAAKVLTRTVPRNLWATTLFLRVPESH